MPLLGAYLLLMLLQLRCIYSAVLVVDRRELLTVWVTSLPIFGTFYFVYMLSGFSDEGVAGNATNWVPYLVFLSGAASFVYFARRGWKAGKNERRDWQGTGVGASTVAQLAGIYLMCAAIDHLAFFSGEPEAGVVFAQSVGANDVPCNGPVLFRDRESTVEYRCPKSIALGGGTSQPFVPWPSYDQGSSRLLKNGIANLKASAVDPAARAAGTK